MSDQSVYEGLNDLDILLFNGQNYWFSSLVEWFTGSPYSHVGVVLQSPTYLHPELTGTYLLESGAEPTPDPIEHRKMFGVQLTDLGQLIPRYTGKVYCRPFVPEGQLELSEKLVPIWSTIKDKPYDYSPIDLIKADLGLHIGNNQRTNSFFCSALVGYVYHKVGLLPEVDWDLLLPRYFAGDVPIQGGTLGPLRQLR